MIVWENDLPIMVPNPEKHSRYDPSLIPAFPKAMFKNYDEFVAYQMKQLDVEDKIHSKYADHLEIDKHDNNIDYASSRAL